MCDFSRSNCMGPNSFCWHVIQRRPIEDHNQEAGRKHRGGRLDGRGCKAHEELTVRPPNKPHEGPSAFYSNRKNMGSVIRPHEGWEDFPKSTKTSNLRVMDIQSVFVFKSVCFFVTCALRIKTQIEKNPHKSAHTGGSHRPAMCRTKTWKKNPTDWGGNKISECIFQHTSNIDCALSDRWWSIIKLLCVVFTVEKKTNQKKLVTLNKKH